MHAELCGKQLSASIGLSQFPARSRRSARHGRVRRLELLDQACPECPVLLKSTRDARTPMFTGLSRVSRAKKNRRAATLTTTEGSMLCCGPSPGKSRLAKQARPKISTIGQPKQTHRRVVIRF